MKTLRWRGGVLAALCLCGYSGPVLAQAATVTVDDGEVIVDGDYVRIEAPDVTVGDAWRDLGRGVDVEPLLVRLGVERKEDYLHLSLAGDVLFDFGSTRITAKAQEVLEDVARLIRARAVGEVLVMGHTDSLGTSIGNQHLSEQRAIEVVRWLSRHGGIPARILLGRGMGDRQPIAHNRTPGGIDDPVGRARNRRVELFLATSADANVRAASLVTVHSSAGEVRIAADRVDIGEGIHVDDAGVVIGAVGIANPRGAPGFERGLGAGGEQIGCSAGRFCESDCPDGGCRMSCSAGAHCDYSCRGGDCEMLCASGAVCDFECAGGDCLFSCARHSTCETSCPGGDCR